MNDVMWEYEPFKERCISRYLGGYETYGIRVTGAHRLTGMRILHTMHDVHCELAAVRALVSLCNGLSLELCHLVDVISDFIP